MNKHHQVILFIIILILWGLFLFYYKIRDLDFGSHFDTKFFMRNLTWQTDFRSSVPYKKGDDIEYSWILTGNAPRYTTIDISSIRNMLDIEHIQLDGTELQANNIISIYTKDASLLKITGKAKNTSTADTVLQPKITVQEEINKEKSVVKKEEPAVVPIPIINPSNISIDKLQYNSNINNLITIRGDNLNAIQFINIGEKRIRPLYSSGTLFVRIDHDTFGSGEYFVFFTLGNGKILTSPYRLSFEHSNSLINIANITPETIQNNEDKYLVIQGNGFDKIISVQLSNNLILKNAEFKLINKQVAWVRIPKGLPAGTYYFNIMDINSIYELKNMHFTITN